ncbi:MAG: DUF4255 domain-containing protein [Nitrosomonas sp.]|nr:DUF4255 domain-containing protein [Nitrosomonas sp.]
MPLPLSPISVVCNDIVDFVSDGMEATTHTITVSMGAPAKVADENDVHRINLFFYRFEPGGFESAAQPNDRWRIRIFCLISVFGINEGSVTAGENDIRLLGELIRIFRENPVFQIDDGIEPVHLQAVFSPITDEQINQVWSTQGDAIYRPSVIYEMALVPIIPSKLRSTSSLVGTLGSQVRATQAARYASFSGVLQGPPVTDSTIDINNPHWVPAICWIYQNECAYSLNFKIDSTEFSTFIPQIWLAGDSSESVDLVWEIWDSKDGWRSAGAPVAAMPFNSMIDADNIPAISPPFPLTVANPVTIPSGLNAAQGVLYAMRTVTIPGQPIVKVRSNPLLLSIYRPE